MTTICWDGKELISDSLTTQASMKALGAFQKIYTPEENDYWELNGVRVVAFGVAGNAQSIDYIKAKLREGVDFQTRFDENEMMFSSIIIDENGVSYKWGCTKDIKRNTDRNELMMFIPPIAVGSGLPYAMGIFAIGKDIRTALKVACKLDIFSGGELQVFTFPGKPEVPSVRPAKLVPVAQEPVAQPETSVA